MVQYDIFKDGVPTGQRVRQGRVCIIKDMEDWPIPASHDWSKGFPHARFDDAGYTRELYVRPPRVPAHNDVVRNAAQELLDQHLTETQSLSITIRLIELVGTAVVTDTPMTNGAKTLAQHAINATKWRIDVIKEMNRAIADGDDPVWPVWNSAWEVIYAYI